MDHSIRILHVIDSLAAGGSEHSLVELAQSLRQRGFQPVIACLYRRSESPDRLAHEYGLDVRYVVPGSRFRQVQSLRGLIHSVAPDVVHTTLYEADILGRLATVRAVPTLTSLVSMPYSAERRSDPRVPAMKLGVAQLIDAITARTLTTHFHAVSDAVRDASVGALRIPAERITVVPRGRDLARLGEPSEGRRRAVRQRLDIGDGVFVVLNVGRHEYAKGQHVLLKAMARVAREIHPVLCLIAGRFGNASSELEELIRELGFGGRVRLLGARDDVPDLLAAADVFAFPSLFEGLPGALLEALALKVPVVASDIPATREILDGGAAGLLVPAGDDAALALELTRLASSPDRRYSLAAAGRIRFERCYTLEQSTNQMASLFTSLVQSRRNPLVP